MGLLSVAIWLNSTAGMLKRPRSSLVLSILGVTAALAFDLVCCDFSGFFPEADSALAELPERLDGVAGRLLRTGLTAGMVGVFLATAWARCHGGSAFYHGDAFASHLAGVVITLQ